MSAIDSVFAWEALDSRGRPTVACEVSLADGARGRAVAPSGASTGGHEAVELRDGGERYEGKGVLGAVANANGALAQAVIGLDARDRPAVDAALEATDGDPALSNLGANAALAISLATTIAAAQSQGVELWQALDGGDEPLIPMPMVNIVSGGAHAAGALDIQDVLAVPLGAASFAEAIEWIARVRAGTASALTDRGGSPALVADEGGLAGALGSNEAALELVVEGIVRAGLAPGDDVSLAVDLAANQLFAAGGYRLEVEDRVLDPAGWTDVVARWCADYPVCSLEDVFAEDEWESWRAAAELAQGRQMLGDDLFATNSQRLARGISDGVANAVLVKVNQAGTVTRAERVVTEAHAAGYATVVSARSGDTEDYWLADLAIGWRAGQIKVGSTMRSERTAKWNRVLEIEARAGAKARFAGRDALPG